MTNEQRIGFYIPKWLEIRAKMDWRMEGGRLVVDVDEQFAGAKNFPDCARDVVRMIIGHARSIAQSNCRAVAEGDLRYGCNHVASNGRTESSKQFGQRDFNNFDRLKNLLQDPWDLTATIAWLNPAADDCKRTLVYLRKIANEARLIAICENAWHHRDVDSLNQGQLDWLVRQVKGNGFPKYPRNAEAQRTRRGAKAGHPF